MIEIRGSQNLCIVLILPCSCIMIKAIIRAVCVALGQLIMTSLAKQFTASQILSIMKLEKLGMELSFTNVTFPGDCLMYRWHLK